MPRQRNNPSSTKNTQGNKVVQRENEKAPENKLKNMEDCDLNYTEFQIPFPKILRYK